MIVSDSLTAPAAPDAAPGAPSARIGDLSTESFLALLKGELGAGGAPGAGVSTLARQGFAPAGLSLPLLPGLTHGGCGCGTTAPVTVININLGAAAQELLPALEENVSTGLAGLLENFGLAETPLGAPEETGLAEAALTAGGETPLTAAAAPEVLGLPTDTEELGQKLGVELARIAEQGPAQGQFSLNHPQYGEIGVELNATAGEIRLGVTTDNAELQTALNAITDGLKSALGEKGITLAAFDINDVSVLGEGAGDDPAGAAQYASLVDDALQTSPLGLVNNFA